MEPYVKFQQLQVTLRNQLCEVELVTPLRLPDGTTQEITHSRQMIVRKIGRRMNQTIIEAVDVDRAALDRVFPFNLYTPGLFPELFAGHVGWRIPQGVGQMLKVPLAWISKSGAIWKYGAVEIWDGNPASVTVQAVYRGTEPGQCALIDAAEYTVGSVTTSTGIMVATINFAQEQLDKSNRPFVLEADILFAGDRTPAGEAKRILTLYGIAIDAASFAAAIAYDTGTGILADTSYGWRDKGRTGSAIVNDLLILARCWLSQTTANNAWAVVQDKPKAPFLQLDTRRDLVNIDESGDGDLVKTGSLQYRPRISGRDEAYAGRLERPCGGVTGEKKYANPYVYEHVVADKWMSYTQKRLTSAELARGTLYAAQVPNGEILEVTDSLTYVGTKQWIATGITRPADRNELQLRKYDADTYVYVAGILPADATNGYAPDLSYTKPLAPTVLAVVGQGSNTAADGVLTAYALIRAVPPATNWVKLFALITDLTTGEFYYGQLFLNAGNYEATIGGMRPGRNHKVEAWAVNASNVDGVVAAAVNFTSATAPNAPGAPTSLAVAQNSPRQINITWVPAPAGVGGTPVKAHIIERKVNAGAFADYKTVGNVNSDNDDSVNIGSSYEYRIRGRDTREQDGALSSSTAPITLQKIISDSLVSTAGINAVSIGSAAINQGRANTGTGSASGTVAAGTGIAVSTDTYSFLPNIRVVLGVSKVYLTPFIGIATDDYGRFGISNENAFGATETYEVYWRKFQP